MEDISFYKLLTLAPAIARLIPHLAAAFYHAVGHGLERFRDSNPGPKGEVARIRMGT
jgi:hypothetical protein